MKVPVRRRWTRQPGSSIRVTPAFLRGLLAALLFAGAVVVGMAHYVVRRVTTRKRTQRPPHYTFTPWEFQIPYRTIRLRTGDDELDAWFLPQPEQHAPCILLLPGHRGSKSELLGIASAFHRDGFACLLLDFRGTGLSTGETITLGHQETEDAITAIDWLVDSIAPDSIGVMGYSLGGSVAINVAAVDQRVGAVVSDSGFASQYAILAYQVRRATGLWPAPILAAAAPMMKRRYRRNYEDFSPVDQVHRISPRPLFLIHPDEDLMVPASHGYALMESAGEPKELWVPEGIGHCGAYFEDREYYCRRVTDFFDCALRSSTRAQAD